jgi:molybdenum cofactor cytidylyltransferase
MNKIPKIALIILAAGASKRMNAVKQLLLWKNTTLLGNVIEQGLISSVDEVYVVLGSNSAKIKAHIATYPIQIIENKNWQNGVGSSIACAINYFKNNHKNFDAVLISLADQPLIKAAYFNLLIEQFLTKKERIITSTIQQKPTVPAIFDTFYFEKLAVLNEDKGAKDLFQTVSNDVFILKTPINLIDIDTLETYKAVFDAFGKSD